MVTYPQGNLRKVHELIWNYFQKIAIVQNVFLQKPPKHTSSVQKGAPFDSCNTEISKKDKTQDEERRKKRRKIFGQWSVAGFLPLQFFPWFCQYPRPPKGY